MVDNIIKILGISWKIFSYPMRYFYPDFLVSLKAVVYNLGGSPGGRVVGTFFHFKVGGGRGSIYLMFVGGF